MAIDSTGGFRPDQENSAYIGAGVTLKGEISVADLLVVDGTVEGDVIARAVFVNPTGAIRGRITATEADISGLINDHIEIEQLLIVRSTGRVEGRVMYGEIELEKGAVVTGDLSSTGDYRTTAKPSVQKPQLAAERVEPVVRVPAAKVPAGKVPDAKVPDAKVPAGKAGNTIDRLNEAVRAAKSGGVKPSVFIATESEPKRRNILRKPLPGRRVSA